MISRQWTAVAKAGEAGRYVEHLRREIWPQLRAIRGFVGATVLRREVPAGTEFRVVTVWESLGAIRAFAGPNPDAAVVPPVVQAMMSAYDRQVLHYDVVDSYPP